MSTDQENDPDILGTIAASTALTISEIPFLGPVGAVRIGRIDGEFVVNPLYSQLAESELDLVVSGTRDAIMMVEAGAKLLTEDVMAEAILFGHRALQPLIDIQLELQKLVGKPKRLPYIEPSADSVLEFLDAARAGSTFVVFDTETTSRDSKMGEIVEIGAVKVVKGKVADRFSTLVKPTRPIVGAQLHGITDKDVAKAPAPADAVASFLDVGRRGHLRRPQRGLRPRVPEELRRGRAGVRAGHVPGHPRPGARGLPGPRRLQAGRDRPLLRLQGGAQPPRPAGRGGDRGAAHPPRR